MKNLMAFFFIVCVLTVNAGAVSAQTAPTPDKPHAINGMPNMGKTGVIEGTVFTLDDKEQKTPISGQEITMVVLNNGQQVLTLKKTTDAKGQFVYKNIFMDQAFAYGFGTVYEDNLYVFPHLSLGADEETKRIDFQIGSGSPYWRDPQTMGQKPSGGMQAPANRDTMSAGNDTHNAHDDESWAQPYRFLAIGLGVLVALVAAYFAGKKSASR